MRATGEHAVVLGASMAGLLAGRVLSDHFERVTVLDRDDLDGARGPRKGVPQGFHTHVLLDHGRSIIEGWFPGLTDDIARNGGLVFDPGKHLVWHQAGGHMPQQETGLRFLSVTRPFLEYEGYLATQAVTADFRFPTTEGQKPPGTDLVNRYLSRFNRAMNGDTKLARAWMDVVNMTRPPRSLFAPALAWHVMRGRP